MFLAHHAPRSDRFNSPRKKKGLRIPIAKRLQHFVPAEKVEVQRRESDLVIELQSRLEILIRQKLASRSTELFRKKIDILLLNGKPRGHFVSAVLVDLVRASSQCLDQIKAFNAATTSFPDTSFLKTDDNYWPMMFVRDARSDDAQNARMPSAFEHHDSRIA